MLFLNICLKLKTLYNQLIVNSKLMFSSLLNSVSQLFNKTSKNTRIDFKSNSFVRDFVFTWKISKTNTLAREVNLALNKDTNNTSNIKSYTTDLAQIPENYSIQTKLYLSSFTHWLSYTLQRSFGFSFYYIQGFIFVLFIDACLTDDEPLWEPIEWSLVQTWILFIFTFAWIAENLIVSRYGSYTGRDKRVWMSWYKTFWLIEGYYVINYAVAAIFVIVPFYFETN